MQDQILICPGDLVLINDYAEKRYWEKSRLRWAEVLDVERKNDQASLRVEGIDMLFDVRLILDWTPIERGAR
ncbi:MAG TPA: hypothetical protein VGC66_05135 [Pyrinomonadaceae bacterium]